MNTWFYDDTQANIVFKTKYPNGKIKTVSHNFETGETLFKIKYDRFQKCQMVWEKSYLDLLRNLGFKVISGTEAYAKLHTVKNFEKIMSDKENPYGYYVGGDYFIPFTEKDLTEIPEGIAAMKKILKENMVLFTDTADFQIKYYKENIDTI